MDTKPARNSRLIIVNVLTLVGTILGSPQVLNLISPEAMQYIIYAQSTINILLRLVTSGAVSVFGKTLVPVTAPAIVAQAGPSGTDVTTIRKVDGDSLPVAIGTPPKQGRD